MSDIDGARQVIADAIRARIFPAASFGVGSSAGMRWREAMGTLTFEDPSKPTHEDTPFDLASLTKPIATTSIIMQLVSEGKLRLGDPVAKYFQEWRGADREAVTIQDLLEHASGLPARLVDPPPLSRREFEHDICALRLEYAPRTMSVYSDLGFILLGFLAADVDGASLVDQFKGITSGLSYGSSSPGALAAPTRPMDEDPRRGRLLVGEVHDNYAAALGGVAGHAGLFGTARDVGTFARGVLRAARGDSALAFPLFTALIARTLTRSTVPGSSRTLGWDTMLPTSSCGTRMSASAIGHAGFTGTSLWIDPDRDRYFVLLTNRACGGGTLDEMKAVRRAFHDSFAD